MPTALLERLGTARVGCGGRGGIVRQPQRALRCHLAPPPARLKIRADRCLHAGDRDLQGAVGAALGLRADSQAIGAEFQILPAQLDDHLRPTGHREKHLNTLCALICDLAGRWLVSADCAATAADLGAAAALADDGRQWHIHAIPADPVSA